MVGAERLLADGQGALVERLGLGVVAHRLVQPRQVVEAGGGVGMLGAERLLADGQGAPVERLGLRVVAHAAVTTRLGC